jgi:hypothetical protein
MAEPYEEAAGTVARAEESIDRNAPGRASVVAYGRLPVSEFAYDRAGAGSPFGDDQRLPLPHSRITYVHPTEADDTPVHP